MPVYEYVCPLCSKEMEVVQKVNDPAPYCSSCVENFYEDSPDLQQIRMQKKISKSSFALKGKWFKQGY